MTTITAKQLKECPAEVLGRVQYGRERLSVTRYRRQVAALVSVEDVHLLERLEEVLDTRDALAAVEEAGRSGTITVAELLDELERRSHRRRYADHRRCGLPVSHRFAVDDLSTSV